MHRTILVLILSIFLSCNAKSTLSNEGNTGLIQIYLKEFDTYFLPDSCSCRMLLDLAGSKNKLQVDVEKCEGQIIFKQVDSSNNLILEGSYVPSLDTLKKYSIAKSAIDGTKKIDIFKYFQPLPNGVWKYYKANVLVKKISYTSGIIGE